MKRGWPAGAALLAAAVTVACTDPVRRLARDPDTLAVVGRYLVTREDFGRAVAYSRGGAGAGDLLQSRLWDALEEEVLVLNDVAAPPAPPEPVGLGPYADPRLRSDAVRQALEERIYSKVSVDDAEVERYYRDHWSDYEKGAGVLLRALLLNGAAQADEARRLLVTRHSFLDVARLYSAAPDRGLPQYFETGELPEFLRPVVAGLRPGTPSEPIEVSAGTYQILLVEKRLERYVLPLEEVAPLIRLRLADAAQERLQAQYTAALRERFPVTLYAAKLPFRYQKEKP